LRKFGRRFRSKRVNFGAFECLVEDPENKTFLAIFERGYLELPRELIDFSATIYGILFYLTFGPFKRKDLEKESPIKFNTCGDKVTVQIELSPEECLEIPLEMDPEDLKRVLKEEWIIVGLKTEQDGFYLTILGGSTRKKVEKNAQRFFREEMIEWINETKNFEFIYRIMKSLERGKPPNLLKLAKRFVPHYQQP